MSRDRLSIEPSKGIIKGVGLHPHSHGSVAVASKTSAGTWIGHRSGQASRGWQFLEILRQFSLTGGFSFLFLLLCADSALHAATMQEDMAPPRPTQRSAEQAIRRCRIQEERCRQLKSFLAARKKVSLSAARCICTTRAMRGGAPKTLAATPQLPPWHIMTGQGPVA